MIRNVDHIIGLSLRSVELRYEESHIISAREPIEESQIIVVLESAIPSFVYHTEPEDLFSVVLTPRFTGTSFSKEQFNIPLVVNVLLPKQPDGWSNGPWNIQDIAELYLSDS